MPGVELGLKDYPYVPGVKLGLKDHLQVSRTVEVGDVNNDRAGTTVYSGKGNIDKPKSYLGLIA